MWYNYPQDVSALGVLRLEGWDRVLLRYAILPVQVPREPLTVHRQFGRQEDRMK